MSVKMTKLSDGASGMFIQSLRFNTTLISFNFYLPLKRENVAVNALLPFVLTTCGEKYPDFSRLNYKLNKLYGARLSASAEKIGDFQLLKMAISVIDDKYTLDNEQLTQQACELLQSLLFEPKLADGAFHDSDVEREKRKAIEHIRGELSEKRIYAKNRMIEEMFSDEDYGVSKCGTEEDVQKITGESLYDAWRNLLAHAYIHVNVISRNLPSGLFETLSEKLSSINRSYITDFSAVRPTKAATEVKTVTERMDVAQGKLVMGFSSDICGEGERATSLMVMADIFGGGPYSRLFSNVREKMSLCYYCAATSVRIKGLVVVESGVEAQNAQKARNEILNQLEIMKNGDFTDFEFESSIKGITDSLKSSNDSQETIDIWYSVKMCSGRLYSPEDVIQELSCVTRENVIKAAQGIKLNTEYLLLPKEENK
ncbi:MAG: insulinase family protein [Clostridia bacterium]|nr:insulinase family protein [Clostridia bacterium]